MSKKPASAARRASSPKPRREGHPLVWSLRLPVWTLMLLGAGIAGALGGGFVGYLTQQAPIPELEDYRPPQTSRVFDGAGKSVVAQFYETKREILELDDMPPALPNAFIAIEDERFYQHFGADPRGIVRAMVTNLRLGRIEHGASTISQQLARNVLTQTIGSARTYERKVREALTAFEIEQRYPKDQILSFYLNQIPLGYNTHGVQAAARTYFGKDAGDLTIAECASLAAIPQAPTLLNPFRSPERNRKRRDLVLEKMYELQMIDAAAYEGAVAQPVVTQRRQEAHRILEAPYFVFHLRSDLIHRPDFESDLLNRSGYDILSTINLEYQKILQEELQRGLPEVEKMILESNAARRYQEERDLAKAGRSMRPRPRQHRLARIASVHTDGVRVDIDGYRGFAPFRKVTDDSSTTQTVRYLKPWFDPDAALVPGQYVDVRIDNVDTDSQTMDVGLLHESHVQGAAVLLDVETGHILAIVGGYDWHDDENDGKFNRAAAGRRQPGSAFKPLLYAIAIESGMSAGRIVMDDRVEFAGGYVPRNYSNTYKGPTTLFKALSDSNNVVTVKLFNLIGFERGLAGYRAFDITEEGPQWDLKPELSLCLGSLSVTPLSIAAAYLPFARGGLAIEPVPVTRVEEETVAERKIHQIKPRQRRVLSPQSAYIVTSMLVDVVRNGTGQGPIGEHFDFREVPSMAGKTGTTTDCVDAWFVGYTPELVLAVYVGFDQTCSMGPKMTGSRVAAPMWREIMRRVLETRGDWKMDFDVPAGIIFRDISSRTGLLASARSYGDEETIPHVPFRQGAEPRDASVGYHGFPYWQYQDPDPEKNEIEDPNSIPSHLYARARTSDDAFRESMDPAAWADIDVGRRSEPDLFNPPWTPESSDEARGAEETDRHEVLRDRDGVHEAEF